MLGQTVRLHPGLAALDPFAHHKGSHNYSPEIEEVVESASLGRLRHVAEPDDGVEANALVEERMTTVALPMAVTCY